MRVGVCICCVCVLECVHGMCTQLCVQHIHNTEKALVSTILDVTLPTYDTQSPPRSNTPTYNTNLCTYTLPTRPHIDPQQHHTPQSSSQRPTALGGLHDNILPAIHKYLP